MINSILKFPIPYRLYQKSVRAKFDEYNFINFIFREVKKKKDPTSKADITKTNQNFRFMLWG